MDYKDQPTDIRTGEEFPVSAFETYLKDTIPGLKGHVDVKQFPSGASNLTYLITCGDRRMILRRPPFGTKAATAHDMGREYKVLKALCEHWSCAPRPLAYTEDESIIGSAFYVMEQIQGIILRRDIPEGLLTSPNQVRALFERFVEVLNELHSLDYEAVGLGDLGKPKGYVTRQVKGWIKRYRAARTPDVPDFESVMEWLEAKMPPETSRHTIVHNDFKFDNVVLDPQNPLNIIGVLDWEMCTLGDPLMDLGSTLGYWIEKTDSAERLLLRTMPTDQEGALTRKEFVTLYGRLSGLQMDNFDFYYCFGIFRLAGIVQQIYYRYYHGQTKDERFQKFAFTVKVLDRAANQIIAESSL